MVSCVLLLILIQFYFLGKKKKSGSGLLLDLAYCQQHSKSCNISLLKVQSEINAQASGRFLFSDGCTRWMLNSRQKQQEITIFILILGYALLQIYISFLALQRPDKPYPKVRGSKSVRGGCCGCGSRGGVCEVSVDVSQQVAHHGWHTRTHVFSRQTGEMPRKRQKKTTLAAKVNNIYFYIFISSHPVICWS